MREIKLTKGFVAFVSDEDYERVNAKKWCASIESRGTKVYAIRWETRDGKRVKIRMSHFVLDIEPGSLPPDLVVHHRDDDGLNNCRENLAVITQAENMLSSQGWKKRGRKVAEPPWLPEELESRL